MDDLNNVLKRQMRKHLGEKPVIPQKWQRMLLAINESLNESDKSRALLERALEISSQEHINYVAISRKIREIAIGIESITTLDSMLSFVVESLKEIPGIAVVLVFKLDETGENVVTTYFSKFSKQMVDGLKSIGHDSERVLGPYPYSQRFKFPVKQSKVVQETLASPKVISSNSVDELFAGVMPTAINNGIQKAGNIKKVTAVPLLVENKVWGAMLFLLDGYVPQDSLEMLAAHISLAIKNVQALHQIMSAEEKVRQTIEAVNEGIISYDLQGYITDINPAGVEIYGYSNKSELIGKNLAEVIDKDELVTFLGLLNNKTPGQFRDMPGKSVGKNGQVRNLEINTTSVKDSEGNLRGYVTSIRDVTARKRAEEQISLQAQLLDNATDAISLHDFDGNILYLNKACGNLGGYSVKEIQKMGFHPDDLTSITNRIEELRKKGHISFEHLIHHKEGFFKPVETHTTLININGRELALNIVRDISERKKAENLIRESERRLKEAQSLGKIGSWEYDYTTNQSTWSDEMYRIFERDKTMGPFGEKEWGSYFLSRENSIAIRGRFDITQVYHEDAVMKLPSGKNKYVHISVIPLKDEKGIVKKGSGIIQDITERKLVEEKLQASERRLSEAQAIGKIGNWEFDYITEQAIWSDEIYRIFERDKALGPADPVTWESYFVTDEGMKETQKQLIRVERYENDFVAKLPTGKIKYIHISILPVVDKNGKLIKSSGIVQDITERKLVEERLQASEKRLREGQAQGKFGNWEFDVASNRVTWSDGMYLLCERDKVLGPADGVTWESYFISGNVKDGLDRITVALQTAGEFQDDEVIKLPNGKIKYIHSIVSPVKDKNGKVIKISGILQDITERKLVEERLKTSEKHLSEAQAIGKIGSWEFDYATNQIRWSDEMYRLFERDKALGPAGVKTWESYFNAGENRFANDETEAALMEKGEFQDDYLVRLPSGKVKTIHTLLLRVKDSDGKPVKTFGILQDITERKLVEEKLQASEKRLREAQALGKIGSYEVDRTTLEVIWSEQTYKLFERDTNLPPLTPEEIQTYFNKEEFDKYLTITLNAASDGVTGTDDIIVNLPSGMNPIYRITVSPIFNSTGKVNKLFGTIQDVTETKEAELQIKEQKDIIDRILDNMKPAVLLLDKEMNIILANRSFVEIFRHSLEEVKGIPITEVLVSDEITRGISEARSSEENITSNEINYTIGNTERHFKFDLVKMERQEMLVILLDVTEERDQQDRLYLTDRLASIGEMAAGIAHELNNPLTGIIGLAELLLNTGTGYSEEAKEDLKLISEEAQRAAEVVKSLLTFARKHEPIARPVQINNVMEGVIRLRSYEHKVNNLEVVTNFDRNLPEVMADQFQLQQVFLNLILNAEQAMLDSKKGKTITITTQHTGDNIKISIADDGPGISPENIHKIFSPFFTTKGVGKGTGLGLSICYGIITNHGGNIHAESELNKGANFVIELPVISASK